jgi:two-component system nitrogen regulation response regulator NtrX
MSSRRTILVVDDEEPILRSLAGVFADEGYHVVTAKDGESALKTLESSSPDLVMLDVWMPGIDGLEVLKRVRERYLRLPVIVMSGHGSIETAVKATKLGAYDFIEKPLSIEKVLLAASHAIERDQLAAENEQLKAKVERKYEMIGGSSALKDLREQIAQVAPSNGWVLITGENGTGKELIARAIHRESRRAAGPFVEVNCAAIPEELIESELFGHEKGSFTGAVGMKRGKFEQAASGTLFLDEIGDMSGKTQAKILRVLQELKFSRVGGSDTIEVDVRIVAATNKDLAAEIEKGNFRTDLYYRVNVVPFKVPPLRDRREDIPQLVDHFLGEFCRENGRPLKKLAPPALSILLSYPWPGNVRELRNVVERMVILCRGVEIGAPDVPEDVRIGAARATGSTLPVARGTDEAGPGVAPAVAAALDAPTLREARGAFEKEFLIRKLAEFGGNVSRTAEAIGLERTNLHRKIKSYGLSR